MKPRPRLLALALPAVLALLPWQTRADDKPKAKDAKADRDAVMVRKLGYAKDLLEGLTQKDYDKLTRSADGLIRCREEVTWRLDQTDDYLFHSNTFWRHVDDLKAAAKKKNIDGATLAFLGMTQSCVKCHEHLRQVSRRTDD